MERYKYLFLFSALAGMMMLGLNSCETTGMDGRDGRSYLSLTYSVDEPQYVDAGNYAIPEYFYWDEYYRIQAGYYTMYYDGLLKRGYSYESYAWEIDYEVYYLQGEPGGYGYHGENAADMYFTIECNPYGPYYYEDMLKSAQVKENEQVSVFADSIVVVKEQHNMGMKLTYRKVEKRK